VLSESIAEGRYYALPRYIFAHMHWLSWIEWHIYVHSTMI